MAAAIEEFKTGLVGRGRKECSQQLASLTELKRVPRAARTCWFDIPAVQN